MQKFLLKFHLREFIFAFFVFSGLFFIFSKPKVQWLCDAAVNGEFATVCAKENGFIKHLDAKEGDTILKGFLLFELDNALLKTEIRQKQKQIQLLKAQAAQQKSHIDQLTQEYISFRSEFEREKLSEEDLKAHLVNLSEAQKSYEKFLIDLGEMASENEVLTVKLHQKQAHSPIKGVIVKKWKHVGEKVNPSEPVFSICNLDKIWIDAHVSEGVFSKLYKKNEVLIQSSAFPGLTLKGKIFFFGVGEAYGKNKKIKIPIKISVLPSKDVALRPGMSVRLGV